MDIKYIGNRISYSENEDRTLVVISGKVDASQVKMLLVWIISWTLCGIAVISQLFGNYEKDLKLTLVIYLIFWIYFEFKIGYAFLWRKWGAELIKIDNEKIAIKRDIKGYGKTNTYFIENIKSLAILEKKTNSFSSVINNSFWSINDNNIVFEYLSKQVSFGIQLSPEEAKLLLGKLKTKIRMKA